MSDFKALFKHSSHYLFANLATKALSFISIPVYTRILTVEDYGIVNVFLSVIGIFSVIFTLGTEVAISRFYYDTKSIDEFKNFVGTTIILSGGIFVIMSLCFLCLLPVISEALAFNSLLTVAIIPVSLYSSINSIFVQIYAPLLESKRIAVVSSIQTYVAFIFSVIIIVCLPDEKYFGQVLGTVLSMAVLGTYLVKQIRPYFHKCFNFGYVKYILSYSLPYLPYSLSGVILAQFGRMIIGRSLGFESAGLYSFAASIAGLMLILITVAHQAWNPYYYRYMNEKDYSSINKDYNLIWKVTLIGALMLILWGNEVGLLLGRKEFWGSLHIVSYLVLGYVFYQWAYVYMRNAGYAKKTIWNTVAVFFSGFLNIFLTAFLIVRYGETGVAVAFCLSYLGLLVISYVLNKIFVKVYAPRILNFMRPLCCFLPFFVLGIIISVSHSIPYSYLFVFKVLLSLSGGFVFLFGYRQAIIKYLKKETFIK